MKKLIFYKNQLMWKNKMYGSLKPLLEPYYSSNLEDHIRGMIFGQALGDSYGLSVEFKTKEWIEYNYKDKVIPFFDYIQTSHNKRWTRGDWTDDTDQMLCIMRSLTTNKKVVPTDIACRFKSWMENGFKECGDQCGMGIGETTHACMTHPQFCVDPFVASNEIYNIRGENTASNGACMRTSIVSSFYFWDFRKVQRNCINIAEVTHANPKCRATCLYMCMVLMSLFQCIHYKQVFKPKRIIEYAITVASSQLSTDKEKEEFYEWCSYSPLENLCFDKGGIGYTYLCLKAFRYGMEISIDDSSYETASKSFKEILHFLIRQGGDADTNGAVCGAILGARIGYSKLPKEWIDKLPYRDVLHKWTDEYLEMLKTIQ